MKFSLDGRAHETEAELFIADTIIGRCLDGFARIIRREDGTNHCWSVSPEYTTVFNPETELYETTVTQGPFRRDLQAESGCSVPANSQYHDMVCNEEKYHEEKQMENPNHSHWGKTHLTANIMTTVQAEQPYTHANQFMSKDLAESAFFTAKLDEEARSADYIGQPKIECAIEKEAKNAVGASHRAAMPCAYFSCP